MDGTEKWSRADMGNGENGKTLVHFTTVSEHVTPITVMSVPIPQFEFASPHPNHITSQQHSIHGDTVLFMTSYIQLRRRHEPKCPTPLAL
jgi:hypothetical protein